ncbi:hypothetical protein IWX64_002289 [Arthrobacter sp. CAN_A212]|uniref:hypothetical protein n=1 Tax=unclassified Arthrobacter TaxID=235627 RepID=UPI0018C99B92|nr:hypothetical protein [Arthrobacter sp. CAN_C5]MBP2217979.1 hypothetical protein [Arthrobacter sp. CAN_C5]
MNKRAARALAIGAMSLALIFAAYAVVLALSGAEPWSVAMTAVFALAYAGLFLSLRRKHLLPPRRSTAIPLAVSAKPE